MEKYQSYWEDPKYSDVNHSITDYQNGVKFVNFYAQVNKRSEKEQLFQALSASKMFESDKLTPVNNIELVKTSINEISDHVLKENRIYFLYQLWKSRKLLFYRIP